ncbi:MAG: twin-arginine translocase subunit TatB [Candidatus Pelagibacter sp.]|nr:twin-arginine translocase subunit TatB [Candidatus Pelagibacter sp.]|tara:strand:+ start:206 stop:424 length:219 start_codon:yes stop_codon:yes gene_type:complete
MPQIGWFELLIIILVAIIIVGPKDFPVIIRKVGSWIGSIKRYFSDVQNSVDKITSLDDDQDAKKDKNDQDRK